MSATIKVISQSREFAKEGIPARLQVVITNNNGKVKDSFTKHLRYDRNTNHFTGIAYGAKGQVINLAFPLGILNNSNLDELMKPTQS